MQLLCGERDSRCSRRPFAPVFSIKGCGCPGVVAVEGVRYMYGKKKIGCVRVWLFKDSRGISILKFQKMWNFSLNGNVFMR